MTQNTLGQSATSLGQVIKAGSKTFRGLSQFAGPFLVSKLDNQTATKHQVSPLADWTNAEKERYTLFVCYFRQLVDEEKSLIRKWNLFKGMSKFVKTRNPTQCRSHHMKLTKEFREISKFILMVRERIPKLTEKILQVENELSQIQIQFNLYLPEQKMGNLCSISENRVFDQQEEQNQATGQNLSTKDEKQHFIRTADSYNQQQHPVKFNNKSFSIFSSRSQFKPFDQFRSKPDRSSLPSFDDEESNPVDEIKQEDKVHETSKVPNQQNEIASFSQEPKISSSQENFNVFSKNFDQLQHEDKVMEKMKEFLECHYLFQLWTSKLQKIMRDS